MDLINILMMERIKKSWIIFKIQLVPHSKQSQPRVQNQLGIKYQRLWSLLGV